MQNSTVSSSASFIAEVGKQRQRILGDGAVVARALDRVLERAVLGHQPDRLFEVGVGRLAFFQRAPPERALALRAAAERQHHRQRDLALAEIVADVLAELGGLAAVVERVVDELERDAEVHAERAAGGPARPSAARRARARPRRRRRTVRRSWRGSPRDTRPRWWRCSWRRRAASPRLRRSRRRPTTGCRAPCSEPTSTIILNAWPSRKSPTSTLASLPHSMRAACWPRRMSLSSTTSSCSSVAVCMNSTAAASLMWPSPAIAGELRHGERQDRAQPLAAGRDQVVGDLRDHRHFRAGARQDRGIDPLQIGGDEVVQTVDGGGRAAFERDDDGQNSIS